MNDYPPQKPSADQQLEAKFARRFIAIGLIGALFGTMHVVDHIIRGYIVLNYNLPPSWNHSGWPFVLAVLVLLVTFGLITAIQARRATRRW